MSKKLHDDKSNVVLEETEKAASATVSRRKFLGISASMVAAGLTSSFPAFAGDDAPGVDLAKKTIRLGAFAAITGPVPFYSMIEHSTDAYFKDRNANGGIKGWKIEYVIRDDAYDPANSLAATRRLVEDDQVFALVVPNGTANCVAILPYTRAKGIPVIAPSGGSPKLVAASNSFPLLPDYALSAASSARYAIDTLKAKKIGLIWLNEELGLRAKFGAELYLKGRGMQLVADAPFDVSASDLTSQVQHVTSAGVDTILLFGSNSQLASGLRSAAASGWKGNWFAPFFVADPSTYDLAGKLLDGVYFSSWLLPVDTDRIAVTTYRKAIQKYYPNDKIGVFGLNGWTGGALFAAGFERLLDSGKPITRANLIDQMNTLQNIPVGATGAVSFSKGDHRGTHAECVIRASGGKFAVAQDFQPYPADVFKAVAAG